VEPAVFFAVIACAALVAIVGVFLLLREPAGHMAEVLPGHVVDNLKQIQTGKFDVHLDHRRLGPSVNRLVMGLIVSSLFLGSSLILSMNVPPVLFYTREGEAPWWFGLQNVSILGISGIIASVFMGLRLLWAIAKSGHLDENK